MATYQYNSEGSNVVKVPTVTQGDTIQFNRTEQGRSGTILEWTVPFTGTYTIEAKGAKGGQRPMGMYTGGYGALIRGDFRLVKGEVLRILVGQQGTYPNSSNTGCGGGGGSFVVKRQGTELLIAAGGGGGAGRDSYYYTHGNGGNALINNTGSYQQTDGGEYDSGAAAGFEYDGQYGAKSFKNGGIGGFVSNGGDGVEGGFGGGAGNSGHVGGGGGGYTGGNGGYLGESYLLNGKKPAGGSSYNIGANPYGVIGTLTAGYVKITVKEVIKLPEAPTNINVGGQLFVGSPITISWKAVSVPNQPDGVVLDRNNAFYDVEFYNGTSWVTVAEKVSTNSVSYTIPTLAEGTKVSFRVRASLLLSGQYFYTAYDQSTNTNYVISANSSTVPGAFIGLAGEYGIGQKVLVKWEPSTDKLGKQIYYDLDFYNGSAWISAATNLATNSYTYTIPNMPDTKSARFRVRSKVEATSGYVASEYLLSDYFVVTSFSVLDNVGVPFLTDIQKKENIDYLRGKVEELRLNNKLGLVNWTDPLILRESTPIKPVHWDELEAAVLEVYDTISTAKFNNPKTEAELRKIKVYESQTELLQALPERMSTISRGLTNK